MADVLGTESTETLNGGAGDDRIYGFGGDDKLNGKAGNDQLYGGAGKNSLHGDAGADIMYGGSGDDTYYVDNPGDTISEETVPGVDDGGNDRVYSSVTFTLPAFVEKLTLSGSAAIDATGNNLANTLTGNSAANILTGLGGKDTLTGGLGADTFMFGPADATSTDKVTDFTAEDWVGIKASDYGLSVGSGLVLDGSGTLVLDPTYFATVSGSSIQGTATGHGQFAYNTTTGTLLWDADGAGTSAGIALATFNSGTVLSTADFAITAVLPVVGNISINDITITEGDSGTTTPFTFTVSRIGGTAAFTVGYIIAGGSATAGSDYTAASGTLDFADGEMSKTVTVQVNGDTAFETDETFLVTLTNASGGTILDGVGQGTITNDDAQPTLSIGDVSLDEGNSGTTPFTFTVTLSAAAGLPVTVNYATTAGGTATAGSDYTAASGMLTFNPGEISKTVTVDVNGDTNSEYDETFLVNLSGAINATIATGSGTGTITNDDASLPPVGNISINDITITEGDSGTTTPFTFTVSRIGGTAAFTVGYIIAGGSATAGSDYTYTAASGTLDFADGEMSKTVTVQVNGDTAFETDETFFVTLTNPSGGTILDGVGQGTITNDDAQPTLSIGDVSRNEGNSATTALNFTVTLSAAAGLPVTVNYATTAGGTATAGSDYTAASGMLTFNPGEISKTVTVDVNGDTTFEANETFFVTLTNASGGSISDDQGVGTITNDDAQPTLSIGDVSRNEGNSATTALNFTVTLSAASGLPVTVHYATAGGTATAGSDYTAASDTLLTFNPGETSKTVTVQVNGDTTVEPNETFFVNLTSASGGTILDGQGQGTITNDDGAPPALNVHVLHVYDTTQYKAGDPSGYGSGDPSGLAYVPSMNTLFIADSEHDESPYFSSVNLFAIRPDGTQINSYSLRSFTREPTGLAYNPINGLLYITDDDARKVVWVDPANPSVKLGEFSVSALGITDAEDPKIDPVTGNIYMLSGASTLSLSSPRPAPWYGRLACRRRSRTQRGWPMTPSTTSSSSRPAPPAARFSNWTVTATYWPRTPPSIVILTRTAIPSQRSRGWSWR